MAPKKKATEGDQGASKKQKTEIPPCDPDWKAIKPSMLCLGEGLEGSSKVAAFDLDGTLIDWKEPNSFSLDPDSWTWFNASVPGKLKELQGDGYKLVIFSNQALIKSALNGQGASKFKAKVDSVLKAAGVKATVLAATLKDENRKPDLGMWKYFTGICNDDTEIDKESSYYVGDFAGRQYDPGDTDKAFAEAIGIPFKVPEDVFGESSRPNKDMASCLKKLADTVRASGDPKAGFKANAFRKAAAAIESHEKKLTSAKEAGKLAGVGKGVQALVTEFLETGVMGEEGKEDADKSAGEQKASHTGKGGAPSKKSAGLAFL